MASQHDYHIAAEPDVSGNVNRHIWFYFIVFGVSLFVTIGGLTIMYRFDVDAEKEKKIGEVETKESLDQMALSDSYLSGNRGLIEGKHHVAIGEAMNKFINDARRAK